MKISPICHAIIFLLACCPFAAVAQPIASFDIVYPSSTCNPATITFTSTSSGNTPLEYNWQFGVSGAEDTLAATSYTYTGCGSFEVILSVTDTFGLSDSDTQQVIIKCAPIADFTLSDTIACDSALISFTDLSTPADSIASWLWDFGDPASGSDNISSLQNPSHFYTISDTFPITLTIMSLNGCSASHIDTLEVIIPVVNFSSGDSTPCVNDSVFFNDLSVTQDSITAWSWNFGDPASGNNSAATQNASHVFAQAGSYSVRLVITTFNGCTGLLKKTIVVTASPVINAGSDATICPSDSVQLQATGAATYQWAPGNSVTDSLIENPFAFPASTTTFFVTGTDTNGCSATDSIIVNVLPPPPANAGSDTTICTGTTATLHATGGISFQWSPPGDFSNDTIADPTVAPFITTVYVVTVKDSSGCVASDSVTVTVSPLPQPAITGLNDYYCEHGAEVLLAAMPEGGIFSGDGVTDTVFNPALLSPGGPYSIYYFYTDSIGCAGSDTASVSILPAPFASITTVDSTVCLNGPLVSFTVDPPGGLISGAGISGTQFDPALAGLGFSQVYYTFTDSSGCSDIDTLLMKVLLPPAINAGPDSAICKGDSIQLQGSGGLSYSWFPDSSLTNALVSNPIAFPSITTLYLLSGTDAQGCSNTDTVLITVLSTDNADAGPDAAICFGDSIMLQASGGTEYSWSPAEGLSDTAIANPWASPFETTMYTVTINGNSACPAIDSVLITVHPLPVIVTSNDSSICFGDSLQLSASGGSTYEWQPALSLDNNQIPNPVAFPEITTTYKVVGTDTLGCSATDSVLITVLPLPVIDAGMDSAICLGDSLQLSAAGAISWQWSPAASLSSDTVFNPIAFPAATTTYVVMGTDGVGCTGKDSVTLFVLSADLVNAGNDTALCIGDTIILHASGGFTYSWSPSVSLSDTTVSDPAAFPSVTTVYTVTVSVGSDCVFSDTITVTVHSLPLVDAGTALPVCPGDSTQLNATGAVSYSWQPGSALSNDQIADPFAHPLSTTSYTVTGTDANGCMNSDTVSVTVLPAPVAFAGNDTAICLGDTVQLQASGGIAYTWSPAAGLNNNSIPNPLAFPGATISYIVQVSDSGLCHGFDTVIITVHPLPDANAGNDQQVCAGSSVQLNATGGITYSWSPAAGLSSTSVSNPVATVDSAISYVVTVSDQFNCTASDTVQLTIVPPINASVSNDTTICKGTSATLQAAGGVSYSWSPSSTLSNASGANTVATPVITTSYSVMISDGLCFQETLDVTVTVSDPQINAGTDATITSGETYTLNATGTFGNYQWSPAEGLSCNNCLNPSVALSSTTTFTVTVTDTAGCIASDDVTINTGCGDDVVFIPNTFSPNGNNKNDILYVRSYGIEQLAFFRIFDRWGHVIFESNNTGDGWDGTYNGRLMPSGVYIYTLEASCASGEVIRKQGNVTLLR